MYGKKKIFYLLNCEGKKIHASFAAAPKTEKVTATVCDKCLIKMEKTLNL